MSHCSEDGDEFESRDGIEDAAHFSEASYRRGYNGQMKHSKLGGGQPRKRRSVDYEVIVAACVEYTFVELPSSSKIAPPPQFHRGDVIQIISTWSTANDGVLQVRNGKLSADGIVNQSDGTPGDDTAYFHCHNLAVDITTLALVPCWKEAGKFACHVASSDSQAVLAGSVSEPGSAAGSLSLKSIDPQGESVRTDPQCAWTFEPQAVFDSGDKCSKSRIWRIYVKLETTSGAGGKSAERFFLMADRSGAVSLTKEDDHASCRCFDTGGLENPKTYFYLYKKTHITEE